jgi:uncharacterized protein
VKGKPCGVELTVLDPNTVLGFYEMMFGWDFQAGKALLGGKVAAVVSHGRLIGRKPAWLVHLCTDDLGATLAAVTAADGAVVRPARAGTAVVRDPTGGYFALSQGAAFEVTDQAGAYCWTEMSSKDPSAAAAFFGKVLGLEVKRPFRGYSYAQLRLEGKQVAGLLGMIHERRPYTGPAAWLVYFQVNDTDDAVELASRHGGTVIEAGEDTPFGRHAILADPVGARFAVITRMG